ncbi:MAG: hypothetical protein L3K16_00040 [Thermoplasmata archaeon]|nr:hypothetical protein [Thermoplasmata archaeon]
MTFGIGILSDRFLLLGVVALYAAFGRLDRAATPVASGFLALYALIDLLVTGPNVVALVAVSQNYASGSLAAQQASLSTATYVRGVVSLTLPLGSGVLSVGILRLGLVLRNRPSDPRVGYRGIATGVVGLAFGLRPGFPALTAFDGPSAVLELVWSAVLGWKLIQLGRRSGWPRDVPPERPSLAERASPP